MRMHTSHQQGCMGEGAHLTRSQALATCRMRSAMNCQLPRNCRQLQSCADQSMLAAEDRVLWYSAQYRDWDVTNGSIAQEVSLLHPDK